MPSPKKVIIDTDGGVDDAIALMVGLGCSAFFHNDNDNEGSIFKNLLDVIAITTVAGNVVVEQATENVWRILELIYQAKIKQDERVHKSHNLETERKSNILRLPYVFQGCPKPLSRPLHTATYVHGNDGLGGITFLKNENGEFVYPAAQHLEKEFWNLIETERSELHYPADKKKFNLEKETDAVDAMIQLVSDYPNEIIIITLGPLTNVAKAVQRNPDVMRNVKEIVIMGGAFESYGNVTLSAEYNIYVDPDAVEVVLGLSSDPRSSVSYSSSSSVLDDNQHQDNKQVINESVDKSDNVKNGVSLKPRIVFVPLDVTEKVWFDQSVMEPYMSTSTFAPLISRMSGKIMSWKRSIGLELGMHMHDPLAVVVAMDQSLVNVIPDNDEHYRVRTEVHVECKGDLTVGKTIGDVRTYHLRTKDPQSFNADVCVSVNPDKFYDLFCGRILKL